jgi:hypothetical protein
MRELFAEAWCLSKHSVTEWDERKPVNPRSPRLGAQSGLPSYALRQASVSRPARLN